MSSYAAALTNMSAMILALGLAALVVREGLTPLLVTVLAVFVSLAALAYVAQSFVQLWREDRP